LKHFLFINHYFLQRIKGGCSMYLLTNGRVITRDPKGKGYYEKGAVAIEGTKILEVGEEAALTAKYPQAEKIDARGGVIMPAFINAHTHIYSALARGLSIVGNNPTNFYEVLDGTWWAIDRKLTWRAPGPPPALYMDSIKQGVTTIFDHHASYCEIPGSLMKIAEVRPGDGHALLPVLRGLRPGRRGEVPAGHTGERGLHHLLPGKRTRHAQAPCSAATRCSPSPTRPSTAWWRPTTAAPATTSMSPRA
jgi:hypothetical protein